MKRDGEVKDGSRAAERLGSAGPGIEAGAERLQGQRARLERSRGEPAAYGAGDRGAENVASGGRVGACICLDRGRSFWRLVRTPSSPGVGADCGGASEAAHQREIAAERARAEEDALAKVDSDVSQEVPSALEPLAALMNRGRDKESREGMNRKSTKGKWGRGKE